MFGTKAAALFLAILCFVQMQCGYGTIQESPGSLNSQQFKDGYIFIGKKSFDNGNLIFAVCDIIVPSAKECRIIQRIYPQKEDVHVCNVTLKGNHDRSDLDFIMGIAPLGKDKAILYWGEDYNNSSTAQIATLNMETCKMNVVKIEDLKRDFITELQVTDKIVVHDDDSFDVFINDPKRFGDKLGKITVNPDGTAKNEPKATNIKAGLIYYLAPIATRSSSKGYAAMRKEEYTLLLIKPDGSEKQLEKYNKTSKPAYSAGENVFNSCVKTNFNSDVTCKQYDEDGNVKYTITIVDTNKNIYPMATHNLPGGGMLVMLAELKQCDEYSICNESKYRIVKIAADGKILGTARTDVFESFTSKYKQKFVYKSGESEYCAAIIGENPNRTEEKQIDYEIIHHCVKEDEFKA